MKHATQVTFGILRMNGIYRYIYKKPHDPWYGLWWIVVLMYTHVVHTSMSILNCPILPGRMGDYVPVSQNYELCSVQSYIHTLYGS